MDEAESTTAEFDVMLELMTKLDGAIAQISRHDKLFGLQSKDPKDDAVGSSASGFSFAVFAVKLIVLSLL